MGIPLTKYGTNFVSDNDKRAQKWKAEQEEYGFDNRETWNLDTTFIEWVYTRVMMFKECADKTVDLSYHKIVYKGEEITQIQAMDKLLELAKQYLTNDDDELRYSNAREICDLWKELMPYMWW